MRVARSPLAAPLLGLASLLMLGCADAASGPDASGALEITVSTSSAPIDVDPDGYTLSIDGGPAQAVSVNGLLAVGALSSGVHIVRLAGLASNCSVDGLNPFAVIVEASRVVTPVSIKVACFSAAESGAGSWDY